MAIISLPKTADYIIFIKKQSHVQM